MNKKNSLAFLTLFVIGLVGLFAFYVYAQKTDSIKVEQPTKTCSGERFVMPETISVNNSAFADYLKVAALARSERIKAFGKLSNEQKAGFVKIQFALQFAKRPNMTDEQKNFLLDSMSKVSADLYDKQNPQKTALANQISQEAESKILGLFERKDALEILEGLGTNKDEDIALLQKYEGLLKSGMQIRKKLVYEMPTAERVAIWKTQLSYHLATSTFNREQKQFIVGIMPNIPSILEASSNLPKEEQIKYLEKLESDIFRVFSKTEAFAVFMELGIQKIVEDTAESPNIVIDDCNCRWYCSKSNETCDNGDCRIVSFCGPFDTWDCTTRCHIS